jgi:hypothetical protein
MRYMPADVFSKITEASTSLPTGERVVALLKDASDLLRTRGEIVTGHAVKAVIADAMTMRERRLARNGSVVVTKGKAPHKGKRGLSFGESHRNNRRMPTPYGSSMGT